MAFTAIRRRNSWIFYWNWTEEKQECAKHIYCSMDAFWGVSARKHLCLHPWSACVIFHAHPTHPHSIIGEHLSRENEGRERILRVDGQKGRFSNTMMSCISQCMPSKGCYSPLYMFYQFLVDGRKRCVHAMYDRKKNLRFQKYLHTCGGGLIVMYLRMFCALGEIGGNMGLFLGSSILTIFEFVDFVIYLCSRRNKKDSWLHKREDSPDYPWML